MRTYKISNIQGHPRFLHVDNNAAVIVWFSSPERMWRSLVWSRNEAAKYLRDVRTMSAYTVERV